jgi:PhnB protein
MASQVKPIPQGYHTATPYLVLNGAARAIEFYKNAFGAQELMRMAGPEGKIGHAEIRIGDSPIMLSDEMMGNKSPDSLGGSPGGIFLYVEDVDGVFDQAIKAGAKEEMRPTNMFWGDRFGSLIDPFGHRWSLATHVEDVAPDEMEKRGRQWREQMAQAASQSGD